MQQAGAAVTCPYTDSKMTECLAGEGSGTELRAQHCNNEKASCNITDKRVTLCKKAEEIEALSSEDKTDRKKELMNLSGDYPLGEVIDEVDKDTSLTTTKQKKDKFEEKAQEKFTDPMLLAFVSGFFIYLLLQFFCCYYCTYQCYLFRCCRTRCACWCNAEKERGPWKGWQKIIQGIAYLTCASGVLVCAIIVNGSSDRIENGINVMFCEVAKMLDDTLSGVVTNDTREGGIVQAVDGFLTVKSNLDVGSTFLTDLDADLTENKGINQAISQMASTLEQMENFYVNASITQNAEAVLLHKCDFCTTMADLLKEAKQALEDSAAGALQELTETLQTQLQDKVAELRKSMDEQGVMLTDLTKMMIDQVDANLLSQDNVDLMTMVADNASLSGKLSLALYIPPLLLGLFLQLLIFRPEVDVGGHYRRLPSYLGGWAYCCSCTFSLLGLLLGSIVFMVCFPVANACIMLIELNSSNLKKVLEVTGELSDDPADNASFSSSTIHSLTECMIPADPGAPKPQGNILAAVLVEGCRETLTDGTFRFPETCPNPPSTDATACKCYTEENGSLPEGAPTMKEKLSEMIASPIKNAFKSYEDKQGGDPLSMDPKMNDLIRLANYPVSNFVFASPNAADRDEVKMFAAAYLNAQKNNIDGNGTDFVVLKDELDAESEKDTGDLGPKQIWDLSIGLQTGLTCNTRKNAIYKGDKTLRDIMKKLYGDAGQDVTKDFRILYGYDVFVKAMESYKYPTGTATSPVFSGTQAFPSLINDICTADGAEEFLEKACVDPPDAETKRILALRCGIEASLVATAFSDGAASDKWYDWGLGNYESLNGPKIPVFPGKNDFTGTSTFAPKFFKGLPAKMCNPCWAAKLFMTLKLLANGVIDHLHSGGSDAFTAAGLKTNELFSWTNQKPTADSTALSTLAPYAAQKEAGTAKACPRVKFVTSGTGETDGTQTLCQEINFDDFAPSCRTFKELPSPASATDLSFATFTRRGDDSTPAEIQKSAWGKDTKWPFGTCVLSNYIMGKQQVYFKSDISSVYWNENGLAATSTMTCNDNDTNSSTYNKFLWDEEHLCSSLEDMDGATANAHGVIPENLYTKFVAYGTALQIVLDKALHRIDEETAVAGPRLTGALKTSVNTNIVDPLMDKVVNGMSCLPMRNAYPQLVEGLCYRVAAGFGTFGSKFAQAAILMGFYGLLCYIIWRRARDNRNVEYDEMQANPNGGAGSSEEFHDVFKH